MTKYYDYIITGAGCAGMSLLVRMIKEPFFKEKKILVIDQASKTTNDRTWCFWEKEHGLFESIVYHRWTKANFYSNNFSSDLDLSPYQYKMIRSIDLYSFAKKESEKHENIEWLYEKVTAIRNSGNTVMVELEAGMLTAQFVFNSILFANPVIENKKVYYLLQHFKGWLIETAQDAFEPTTTTFMDFRVKQAHGTTFMYVLPVSKTKALVEYTLFTEKLLESEQYEIALREYINTELGIKEYTILHEENGVIPMTNHCFPLQKGNIVYMGIAGGQVKGSSGYAFQFIQKRTNQIIELLLSGNSRFDHISLKDKKFRLFDSVLLNVLWHKRMDGDKIFTAIFQKNKTAKVLRFLDNESSLWEDLAIMRSVPGMVFLPAACKELL